MLAPRSLLLLLLLLPASPVAGQDEPQCLTQPDQTRQSLRAPAAGNHGKSDLRLAQLRALGGDSDVSRERELTATPQTEAVDHGHDRLHAGGEYLTRLWRMMLPLQAAAASRRSHSSRCGKRCTMKNQGAMM